MKRISSIILSLLMLLSITSVTAFAANEPAVGVIDHPIVELAAENATLTLGNTEFTALDSSAQSYQEIDFTNAINVTSAFLGNTATGSNVVDEEMATVNEPISPLETTENLAPVGTPQIFILNSDSIRDGQYTTASVFFLATRWNSTDLCYDPEGGPLTLIYNTSFPSGYIAEVADAAGTYAGYMINVSNRGSYPFVFAFMDSAGDATEISSLTFDIISRGVFETVNGSLAAETEVDEYQITVDFSVADSYVLSAMRTGTGGFLIKAYDGNQGNSMIKNP